MTSSRSFSSAIARSTYGLMFSAASKTLSFAFISRRSFPRRLSAKPLLLSLLILAGCGGAGGGGSQVVHGAGFTFQAPASWTVAGNAAVDGAVNRVEVLPFRLLRAYDAARRAAAARELDR